VGTLAIDIFFYPSLILLATGITATLIALLFYMKLTSLKQIPADLDANAFNKTFFVFNPYEAKRKIIHKFIGAMPAFVFLAGFGLAILMFVAIQAGLLLTIITAILALGIMVVEEGSEAYRYSTDLIKAYRHKPTFGTGDIRTFHLTKKILPRLITYYAAIAAVCLAISLIVPAVFNMILYSLSLGIGAAQEGSTGIGPAAVQIIVFAIVAALILLELAMLGIRTKFLSFGITSEE
jgi:hypothetical protein